MVNGMVQVQIYFTKQLIMQLKQKNPLTLVIFFLIFMKLKKKGTGYVMGTLEEWRKLTIKGLGYLMPFIVRRTSSGHIDVGITRNKIFLTDSTALGTSDPLAGILKNCRYLGDFELDEEETKKLQ